jgi:hypothetical protein
MSQNVQKTFLVDDKKSKNKEKLTAKKLRPIFWNFNFWWVVFIIRKHSENFLCLLSVYRFMLNSEPC